MRRRRYGRTGVLRKARSFSRLDCESLGCGNPLTASLLPRIAPEGSDYPRATGTAGTTQNKAAYCVLVFCASCHNVHLDRPFAETVFDIPLSVSWRGSFGMMESVEKGPPHCKRIPLNHVSIPLGPGTEALAIRGQDAQCAGWTDRLALRRGSAKQPLRIQSCPHMPRNIRRKEAHFMKGNWLSEAAMFRERDAVELFVIAICRRQ
ncbi:uncharacterized protein B0H64DRAFT_3103 [Chaetomium fimeti]|uniref:Uncharacterized protein n=1 Tax=Chaetomium fimeti TaxID=1854472 RepID=A0AAE0LX43_9PEZI|nr:hypothetical protein B0H64DRAFT_3103 [Chaetomium fimeti]